MAIVMMPDGSQWDIPALDSGPQPTALRTAGTWRVMTMPSGEHLYVQESDAPASLAAPPNFRDFLRQIGSRGGQSRAIRHNRRELAAWGRTRRRKVSVTAASSDATAQATEQKSAAPLILTSAQFRQHLLQQAVPPSRRNDYLSQIGRKGGVNRAARHTPGERREWARQGGLAKAKAASKRNRDCPQSISEAS
jgi:general stress protein YciG